ncbi:MAG: hypothetical protein HY689_04110 [Chloroflexi bacterium]|nr:hypothetical protein [Chloroflexota bacterium]
MLSNDVLRHAFHRAQTQGRTYLVAGRWPATLETLAEALGCPQETAGKVGLCRAPAEGEDLDAWSRTIADRFALDWERVRQVAARLTLTVP